MRLEKMRIQNMITLLTQCQNGAFVVDPACGDKNFGIMARDLAVQLAELDSATHFQLKDKTVSDA